MIVNEKDIKEAISIEAVLQNLGIELDSRHRCGCPVHGGKDKNFSVKNGVGTCWSTCGGESWDAIGLLMEVKTLTYPEALEYAAKLARVPVEYKQGIRAKEEIERAKKEKAEQEALYILNKDVAKTYFYRDFDLKDGVLVQKSDASLNWGYERTFSDEAIQEFKLCFSPQSDFHFISGQAASKHWDSVKLRILGIVKRTDGKYVDKFVDKIVIPIINEYGKFVGYTLRQHPDRYNDKFPKYINSQESRIFKKRELLYGLYHNKRTIKKLDQALLVEGNFDVISLWDHNIRNAVAASGTAVTLEQAKLLKRYTKNVTIMMDGDEAGIKSAINTVQLLIKEGFNVMVCPVDEGEDPDTMIRKHKEEGFRFYLAEKTELGIRWVVKTQLGDNPSLFDKESALNVAAAILAHEESDTLRDDYCKEVHKLTGKSLGVVRDKVKEKRDEILEKQNEKRFSPTQLRDINHYGFYKEKHSYYFTNGDNPGHGQKLSNFIIKPLFLVKSRNNQRLFEITNQFGDVELIAESTKVFVSLDNFNTAVENVGNFLFEGEKKHFRSLKRKIYNEMKSAQELNVLGHNSAGFWAWGNGLYIYKDRKFLEADEYGIVQYDNQHYYLPAFSKVNHLLDSADADAFSEEKHFIYEAPQITFKDWADQFIKVHGNNGKIGMLYYLSIIFRDVIFPRFDFFPHINSVGPTGSGKSFMMWSLSAMFGKAIKPFMLKTGTDVSFFNRWTRFRNGLSWFDEYFNDIDPKRVQYLKYAFDGVGREKGQKEDNRSLKSAVIASSAITGQDLPTIDPALFNRVINLVYSKSDFTEEEQEQAEKLKKLDKEAGLSGLTSLIASERDFISDQFNQKFDEIYSKMMKQIQDVENLPTRLVKSNCILLTVYELLKSKFQLPFDDAWDVILSNMIRHAGMLGGSSEVGEFFDIFMYMVNGKIIQKDNHFGIREKVDRIKILLDKRTKKTGDKILDDFTDVLLINISKVHPLYLEASAKQRRKSQSKVTLVHYLKTIPAYLGDVKMVKKVGYSMAFSVNRLGLDFRAEEEEEVDYPEGWDS